MSLDKYQELEENIKLRNKLLCAGIGYQIVGPTGPQGPTGMTGPQGMQGPIGPIAVSSNEGIFFTSFQDSVISDAMNLEDTWFIPSVSPYFSLPSENQIEVQPGIYEITFSGLIEKADDTHGATFYIKTGEGAALKDTVFKLEAGDGKQMNFSQTILFRFEDATILQATVDILGEEDTSNVVVSSVNLIMKKIYTGDI